MFEEISQDSFAAKEERILRFWQKEQIFEKSLLNRQGAPLFTFYDGPPFATGLPHYGHLLAGTIKDVVLRYQTMRGYYAPRRFGWDCHGLPIENEIEKAQSLSGAKEIEAFGIARFNEECRNIVLRYTEEWKATVARMGRWVDFSQTWHTMDLPFMESVWWVFKSLYEAGLVYEGYKVMPFSAKLGTPLSNFEAGENYQEVDDPSLTVALKLVEEPNTSLLIWTTTPWTLVSNLAVMVGPEIDYVKLRHPETHQQLILAEARISAYPQLEGYEQVGRVKGKALAGERYRPLFPYFANRAAQGAFRVILEPSVSLEEGTGLVHSAPAFGEVDFEAAKREGIELVCPVDHNGRFTAEIPEHQGLFVKDADKAIIKRIKEAGQLFHQGTCHHRYPFCWRSDTPLIYKAVATWFVAVEKIKPRLLAANEQIEWMPAHIQKGRFGKWLEGARDWAISRNRYWGTPIPLWRAEDGEILVLGSLAELQEKTGTVVSDLHRHFIDDLPITHKGKLFRRIPEVFDCWFESGSMPYAQNHYPFENQELFEKTFPADFIGEGLDQTRGWFYTLTILAAALFDKPAFKHVVVNGIVLAEDGAKMSKRLRNYPDPLEVVRSYGADAIRLYLLHSPAVRGEDVRFSEKGVELVLRQVLLPLWNAFSFLATYARLYRWSPPDTFARPAAEIDRWMLSRLHRLYEEVGREMDRYDLNLSVEPFVDFIDQLTNWYIRRSRRRFWEEADTPDRREAFETLYQVILGVVQVAAPFVPFLADEIYRQLRRSTDPLSVHLCDWPCARQELRESGLEEAMAAVQSVVSLGHSLRKEHKLKVRQPLLAAHVSAGDPRVFAALKEHQQLIADELNVKEVRFAQDETEFVRLIAKPNFRELGKKVGKRMKAVQAAIQNLDQSKLEQLLQGASVVLDIEGEPLEITPQGVQVEREVRAGSVAANAGVVTIALETELTEELLMEGLAREIVNKVNTMRREAGFAVSDRIRLKVDSTERVGKCLRQFEAMICGEVLAVEISLGPCEGVEWDLNGEPSRIAVALWRK